MFIKKNIYLYALVFMLLAVLAFNSGIGAFADTIISWGITPNHRGEKPCAPQGSAKILAENNGIFVKDTDEKKVYFTFDLGYEAGYTNQVLDILQEHDIKAIFFLCGNYLKEEAIINRMLKDGHNIGNHTDKHKDLPTLSDENIKKDIATLGESYKKLYNQDMKFFRPPQGRISERVLKIANGEGLKTVMWSIAIVDWGKTPIDAVKNADKIIKRLHSGAIILFHITNSGTVDMLKQLIPQIKEKGYQIDSPDNLL